MVDGISSARRTWDSIAPSFDRTRDRPWPFVETFLKGLPKGSRLLDAGAGNGRHATVARECGLDPIALDISGELLRRNPAATPRVQGALQRLPLAPRSFDATICVAAIHHIKDREERLGAWRALREVLRPGGALLASAWSRDDPRFDAGLPSGGEEAGDVLIAWTQTSPPTPRFTHLYAKGELAEELREARFSDIKERLELVGFQRPAHNLVAEARRQPQD